MFYFKIMHGNEVVLSSECGYLSKTDAQLRAVRAAKDFAYKRGIVSKELSVCVIFM